MAPEAYGIFTLFGLGQLNPLMSHGIAPSNSLSVPFLPPSPSHQAQAGIPPPPGSMSLRGKRHNSMLT